VATVIRIPKRKRNFLPATMADAFVCTRWGPGARGLRAHARAKVGKLYDLRTKCSVNRTVTAKERRVLNRYNTTGAFQKSSHLS
jgi:hypothetical protein